MYSVNPILHDELISWIPLFVSISAIS